MTTTQDKVTSPGQTEWLDEELTSRERARRALAGLPVDRPAAINPTSNINIDLMDMTNSPFPRAHREPQLMANLAETGHTVLGFDSIMPVFSIIQESVALGMTVDWMEKDNWATCRGILATRPEDIKFPKDWLKQETAMCVTDALRELRRRQPDAFLIGKVLSSTVGSEAWNSRDLKSRPH